MSPEICENKDYSFKTDIWSLGVILYELCALKPPFEANSLAALALKILRGEYNPLPGSFSKDIRKLIIEMLTVDPSKRPSISTVLKNPLIKSRIANYVSKNTSMTRDTDLNLK
jgi:NIMA (never in mitosis gene a)-related kinase